MNSPSNLVVFPGTIISTFDFDRIIDRQQTASLKWDRYRGQDILPLWVADMDFRSPPAVIAALHRRVEHGIFGYTVAPEGLPATIISLLAERYGWQVQPEWLVWLPGLVTGLNVACRTIGDEGDEVLTSVPIYPPFLSAPANSRRRLRSVPLVQKQDRWEIDFEAFEAAITNRTRLFLLCSPHNPTGRVFSRSELERLTTICLKHDIVICSDEIHAELVLALDRHHTPTAVLDAEVARRTITLMAPSKTYNIPGLGCSFAIIPDQTLRRNFRQAMAGIVPEISLFGYTAALAAYQEGREWLEALLVYLRGNHDRVMAAVKAMPGLAVNQVEATYLAWIDTRAAAIPEPAAFFEAAGVGLSDGRDFGGPGFVRLNFGCPRTTLDKALTRMARALERRESL